MKQYILFLFVLLPILLLFAAAPAVYALGPEVPLLDAPALTALIEDNAFTTPLTITVNQHGVGLNDTGSSTITFTASCTYASLPPDACVAAGPITWASHGVTGTGSPTAAGSITSGGVFTWLVAVNGTNYPLGTFMATSNVTATVTGACNGSATVCSDFGVVQGQHKGDTWNILVTPGVQVFNQIGTPPLNVVVGASVQLGAGYTLNGGSSANPTQTCNWSANNGHFTIDRNGVATAVSAGTTIFTCNQNGNAATGGGSPTQTLIAVTVSNPTPKTWYVRSDGGTPYSATNKAGRCSGLVDAPDPGSGRNQPCAFGDFEYLYFDQVTHLQALWLITGGDTVIVRKPTHGGTYHLALINQPSYIPTNCNSNSIYNGCDVPNIPSGPDSAHPTIIEGENWASCSLPNGPDPSKQTPLTLWGREGFTTQISQNVKLKCLAISDDGTLHGGKGIWESALTSNVTYENVSTTHTFMSVFGPPGKGVVFDHFLADQNPNFGINMDDAPLYSGQAYSNISGAGDFTLTNSTIQYAGCYSLTAGSCFDHGSNPQAQPDGISEGNIIGTLTLDNDIIRYNMEDGLDALHAVLQGVAVSNSQFYGNIGQQAKIGPSNATTLINNTFIGNCNRMKEPFNGVTYANSGVSPCRGGGGVVNPAISGGPYNFQSNTFVLIGNVGFLQGCAYGWGCFDSAAVTAWQDNIILGYTGTAAAYGSGTKAPAFGTTNINTTFNHNSYYNVTNTGTLGTGDITTNPLLAGEVAAPPLTPLVGAGESVLDGFNFIPTSSSTVKWTGTTYTGQSPTAQNGVTLHSPPSMGAFELGGTPSTTIIK